MRFVPLAILALFGTSFARADPGSVDVSFTPTPAPNGAVRALFVLDDGGILVGGDFTQPGTHLVKYWPDGTLDPTFAPVLDGAVHSIDNYFNDVMVGGAFTTVNGTRSGSLARLNLDGTLDTQDPVGTGFDGPVHSVYARGPDLYVAGSFSNYQGRPALNAAALSDALLGTDYRVNGPVYAVSDWFGNAVAAGGSFTRAGSARTMNFALLDRFSPSTGGILVNDEVRALAFKGVAPPFREIVALGGTFTNRNGSGLETFVSDQGRIVRVELEGAPPIPGVSALAFDSQNGLVVADENGEFHRFENLRRIGTRYSYTAQPLFMETGRAMGTVHAIVKEGAGRYYVGGSFPTIDRQARPNFARLYGPNGTSLPDPPSITGIKVADDRAWIECDPISYALDYLVEYRATGLADWQPGFTSTRSSGFLLGLRPGSSYEVRARARNTNGLGPAGSSQTLVTQPAGTTSGRPIHHPVPPDWIDVGVLDHLFLDSNGHLGITGMNDIEGILTGGFVLIDEHFKVVQSLNDTNNPRAEHVAPDPRGGLVVEAPLGQLFRLRPDGQPDPAFSSTHDFSNRIRRLEVQSDGRIVVGGTLREADGDPNDALARLNTDGTIDDAFAPVFLDGATPGAVDDFELLASDRLLVIGDFDSVNGVSREGIVILTAAGAVDTSFVPADDVQFWGIEDAVVDARGRVYLGGRLGNNPDGGRNGVLRLLADGSIDPSWVPTVAEEGLTDRNLEVLELQPDGRLLAAGGFDTVNGTPARSIIRLHSDGTIDPSFDAGLGLLSITGRPSSAILDLVILPDSTIAVLGSFSHADGEPRTDLVLLHGDTTPSDWSRWLDTNNLPPDSDPTRDDDRDANDLGLEFAYRRNPALADPFPAITPGIRKARIAPPLQRGVTVTGFFSADLTGNRWEPVPIRPDWTIFPPDATTTGFFRFELVPKPAP